MGCPYQYYKNPNEYYARLYCRTENDKICIYSKRCQIQEKYIPIDELDFSWKECYLFVEQQKKDIPTQSYYVQTYRIGKNGKVILYVLVGESIKKIQTNYTEFNQNFIYLKEGAQGYEVSLIPFKTKEKELPKRSYNKKTKSKVKTDEE